MTRPMIGINVALPGDEEYAARISAVLRVIVSYYDDVEDDLTEVEVAANRQRAMDRLDALGPESYRFARMIFDDAIRYAPEVWPDLPAHLAVEGGAA